MIKLSSYFPADLYYSNVDTLKQTEDAFLNLKCDELKMNFDNLISGYFLTFPQPF